MSYERTPEIRSRAKAAAEKHWAGRRKKATCHPERKHQGHGLCKPCWDRKYRVEDGKAKRYYEANATRIRAVAVSRRASHRDEINMARREARKRDPARFIANDLKVSVDDVRLVLAVPNCEICESAVDLVVDHDHEARVVRGRLCRICNTGLGAFRDSEELVAKALAYLGRNLLRAAS